MTIHLLDPAHLDDAAEVIALSAERRIRSAGSVPPPSEELRRLAAGRLRGSSESRVMVGSESSGFEQRSGDVVREVTKAEGRPAEPFESAVERLGRAVRGAGRSKNANTSTARCFRVRPSQRISTSVAGTPLLTTSITGSSQMRV